MAKLKGAVDVSTALANLQAGSGKKSSQKLFVYSEKPKVTGDIIPFGITDVDEATGLGGIMRGRIIELFGPESGGKSYLAYKLIASAQKLYPDRAAGLIDVEHSFVEDWAAGHGVDVSNLAYGTDFDYGEDALNWTRKLVEKGICSIVVLDSTAALIPKAELEASLEDSKIAELGRIMSRSVKQIMDAAAKANTAVVFVNQIRSKVGVMFGNPETTPGGRALKFYAHMRLSVRRIGLIKSKDNSEVMGIQSKLKVEKNKLAMPFRTAEFIIPFSAKLSDPLVRLVQRSYELKVIRKRNLKDEDRIVYMWGKGKETVQIDAGDFIMIADWLVKQGKVMDLLDDTIQKAVSSGIDLEPELVELRDVKTFKSPLADGENIDESESGEIFTKSSD